jgi:hypothetical protein
MSSWGSYPSIFNLGHKAISDLLTVDVNVEEKVDGSQFSFGKVPASPVDAVYETHEGIDYALKIRSKGCVMHIDAPEKMFSRAAEVVRNLGPELRVGWTYRGEYLAKAKHNSLAYDRAPTNNIILYDINTGEQEFLPYEQKAAESARLGLEVVPLLASGRVTSIEQFRAYLDTVSILGGQKIEGVVIKPKDYNLFGPDKKVLMGKFVSEAFKEVHRKAWGESNPTNKDIIQRITDQYCSPARWNKAIQHLKEAGKLTGELKDIGPLMKEIPEDVLKECKEEIMALLFEYAWPHIRRGVARGFPEFYKDKLLREQFENAPSKE